MVKRIERLLALLIVLASAAYAPRVAAQNAPPPGKLEANPPQSLASFGGLKVNDTVAEGWKVRDISFRGRELLINVSGNAQPLVIVFSLESGTAGAFDRDGVRIYYQKSALPEKTIRRIGKATVDRVATFAAGRHGLQPYVGDEIARAISSHPKDYVSAKAARAFLDRLEGKWTVTVVAWDKGSAIPRNIGSGTAQRQRFLNDLILREDTEGREGRQFMTVGCTTDSGRCWLFLIDNASSGFNGGYGVFSGSENALKIMSASGDPIVILRVVDQDRNLLEFYEPGAHPRVVKTVRYDRGK